jgi:hypothetical protein
MSLVKDDHVVQAFAADTPDQPFDIGVLLRTPGCDHDVLDLHMPHPLPKRGAVDAIVVSQEIPWCLVPGEGFDDLLCGRSCTARVRIMNWVFSKWTRLIQIILSASLQSGFHGFGHRLMALCRHTASAESHDHRPQPCRVLMASGAAATVAHGTGAPLSGSTHDRSGRRPLQVSVAATV